MYSVLNSIHLEYTDTASTCVPGWVEAGGYASRPTISSQRQHHLELHITIARTRSILDRGLHEGSRGVEAQAFWTVFLTFSTIHTPIHIYIVVHTYVYPYLLQFRCVTDQITEHRNSPAGNGTTSLGTFDFSTPIHRCARLSPRFRENQDPPVETKTRYLTSLLFQGNVSIYTDYARNSCEIDRFTVAMITDKLPVNLVFFKVLLAICRSQVTNQLECVVNRQ